jgi:hypothetical protein
MTLPELSMTAPRPFHGRQPRPLLGDGKFARNLKSDMDEIFRKFTASALLEKLTVVIPMAESYAEHLFRKKVFEHFRLFLSPLTAFRNAKLEIRLQCTDRGKAGLKDDVFRYTKALEANAASGNMNMGLSREEAIEID